jgi:UDP-glucose 4-epimerase
MKVLVTGGAGYIGSFMVRRLLDDRHEVVVLDSLERGYQEAVDTRAVFKQGDILDLANVRSVFSEHQFDAVMHFAAYISVAESMEEPGKYIRNNVLSTMQLLDLMHEKNVRKFIFSSTGTVYGSPEELPIPETHKTAPENPYAESKLMVERILHWYHEAHGISYAILRYFNASGAALDGSMGELHDPETHLIPNAIKAALDGTDFTLYGTDYETKDGTCVRDYIHVLDLIEAHMLTLKKMDNTPGSYTYNVGTGIGITNKEVIEMVKKISGNDFPIITKERRPGDVAETVADSAKIMSELQFVPKHSDLETIITTAWKWHEKKAKGIE